MLAGGHAENALPALATATVNCRLIPGETSADVLRQLQGAPSPTPASRSPRSIRPSRHRHRRSSPSASPWSRRPASAAWGHDVPISPVQENGATDGLYFRNAGIPVYGVTGIPMPVGEERMHGKDERIPVKSFREGVAFATALMNGDCRNAPRAGNRPATPRARRSPCCHAATFLGTSSLALAGDGVRNCQPLAGSIAPRHRTASEAAAKHRRR